MMAIEVMAALLLLAVVEVSLGDNIEAVEQKAPWRIHTKFSVECQTTSIDRRRSVSGEEVCFFSCRGAQQSTRTCTLCIKHVLQGGARYPAINNPVGINHWLKHNKDAENVDWVVILDANMIIRGPIIP